jgi:c-di-GMP-binding flagellar brake protein YcgR
LNPQYLVRPDLARTILLDAIKCHAPAVLTYQSAAGWAMLKSRFVGTEADSESILLELPHSLEPDTRLPEASQNVGVSFRRGHRKYVFNAMVIDGSEPGDTNRRTPVLRVAWPEELNELQRRLYHRTPVPQDRLIPVDLSLAQAGPDRLVDSIPQRGRMIDLSAGGISVEIPHEMRPRWREDDQLSCRFATGPDRDPLEIPARITHYSRTTGGHIQLGLQFLGLDACEQGRQVLQRIHQMTNRLQRFRRDRH